MLLGHCGVHGAVLVAICLAASAPSADGAVLTYSFTGEINSGPAKAVLGIDVGDPIVGQLTYDSETKLFGILGGVSIYRQNPVVSPNGMSLKIGSEDFSTPSGQAWYIGVSNNDADLDEIGFSYSIPIAPNPNLPGVTSISVTVQLTDSTQSVFSDESLPSSLVGNNFDQKQLLIDLSVISAGADYTGTLDSFALVPEPGTFGLALTATVLGVGYTCWRRRVRFSRASRWHARSR